MHRAALSRSLAQGESINFRGSRLGMKSGQATRLNFKMYHNSFCVFLHILLGTFSRDNSGVAGKRGRQSYVLPEPPVASFGIITNMI